jgi:hypothetical protein
MVAGSGSCVAQLFSTCMCASCPENIEDSTITLSEIQFGSNSSRILDMDTHLLGITWPWETAVKRSLNYWMLFIAVSTCVHVVITISIYIDVPEPDAVSIISFAVCSSFSNLARSTAVTAYIAKKYWSRLPNVYIKYMGVIRRRNCSR